MKGKFGFNPVNGAGVTSLNPKCDQTCTVDYVASKCKGCNTYNGKCGASATGSPNSIEDGFPICRNTNNDCDPGLLHPSVISSAMTPRTNVQQGVPTK